MEKCDTRFLCMELDIGLNSQIHANRADSENWILFQFKTAQNIISGRNSAYIFATKDDPTRKFEILQ